MGHYATCIVVIGCVWFVVRLILRMQERTARLQREALQVAKEAIAAQERSAKIALDRIVALKDYQAFGLVKEESAPSRESRSVVPVRM